MRFVRRRRKSSLELGCEPRTFARIHTLAQELTADRTRGWSVPVGLARPHRDVAVMDHTYYRERRIQPLLTRVIAYLGVPTFTTALDNSRRLLLISLDYYSASVQSIHRSCDVAPTARRHWSPSATQCGFNRFGPGGVFPVIETA